MFEEMCGAIISLILIATASINPQANLEAVGRKCNLFILSQFTSEIKLIF